LKKVVVCIDQPWKYNTPTEIQNTIGSGWEGFGRADLLNQAIPDKKTPVGNFSAVTVHRHQKISISNQECRHF
jgi:hypothetical protein